MLNQDMPLDTRPDKLLECHARLLIPKHPLVLAIQIEPSPVLSLFPSDRRSGRSFYGDASDEHTAPDGRTSSDPTW